MKASAETRRFEARSEFVNASATVTVQLDGTGAVLLALPPWTMSVRFTVAQLAALVEHLAELRDEP